MRACTGKTGFTQYETCVTHPNLGMIGRSKKLEDVGRVASSFPDSFRKDRSDSASRVPNADFAKKLTRRLHPGLLNVAFRKRYFWHTRCKNK